MPPTNCANAWTRPACRWTSACSTYASFSYLKYGPLRLFSQMAQDTELKLGKVLWVAGHSGPETAEDSRTHFGIFETGVTQLFPEGQVIDLHPFEYNEVPVLLGAALAQAAPIVALHLTRPAIEIPDREALGIPSHFEAARGAYVMRDFRPGQPAMGTVFVRGTATTANLVNVLPELDRRRLNVKIVAAISPQLFRLQDAAYREATVSDVDRWDAMAITNGSFKHMRDWLDGPLAAEYSLSADWDDRWRTGGSLDEVIEEAHLDPRHILDGIERFARDRGARVQRLRETAHYLPDATYEDGGGLRMGHPELRTMYHGFARDFPLLEVQIVHEYVGGPETSGLEFDALLRDRDGKPFRIRGVNVVVVRDGKFVSVRSYEDAPSPA
jgi:ketosteroid isomerase-like protein